MIVGHMFDKFQDEVGCVANGPHNVARVGPRVLDSLLGAIVGARHGGALGSTQVPFQVQEFKYDVFSVQLVGSCRRSAQTFTLPICPNCTTSNLEVSSHVRCSQCPFQRWYHARLAAPSPCCPKSGENDCIWQLISHGRSTSDLCRKTLRPWPASAPPLRQT